MWRSAALMGLLMLTACSADRGRITAADNETCAGYGFKPGTDAFANCRMRLETQRADHQEARRRDIPNSIPDAPLQVPSTPPGYPR
jgi:hypothetical protein